MSLTVTSNIDSVVWLFEMSYDYDRILLFFRKIIEGREIMQCSRVKGEHTVTTNEIRFCGALIAELFY